MLQYHYLKPVFRIQISHLEFPKNTHTNTNGYFVLKPCF